MNLIYFELVNYKLEFYWNTEAGQERTRYLVDVRVCEVDRLECAFAVCCCLSGAVGCVLTGFAAVSTVGLIRIKTLRLLPGSGTRPHNQSQSLLKTYFPLALHFLPCTHVLNTDIICHWPTDTFRDSDMLIVLTRFAGYDT